MNECESDVPDGPERLRVGDIVRLREPHQNYRAGVRARIVGFYWLEMPEALVAMEDGEHARVPVNKLEQPV